MYFLFRILFIFFRPNSQGDIVEMGSLTMSIDEVVEELMKINKSLPIRPGIDEVEAAKALIKNVEKEEQTRMEIIAKQNKRKDVPEELFKILQEMQRNLVDFQSREQKREAVKLLDLENAHYLFDELIQRASKCLSSNSQANNTSSASSRNSSGLSLANSSSFSGSSFSSPATATTTTTTSSSSFYSEKEPAKVSELVTKDDSYLKKVKTTFQLDGISFGVQSGNASSAPQIVDSSLKPSTGEFNLFPAPYFAFKAPIIFLCVSVCVCVLGLNFTGSSLKFYHNLFDLLGSESTFCTYLVDF